MNNQETKLILSHLEYIRKRVDDINGRVRRNEQTISKLKGIGSVITFIITGVLSYIIKE